MPARVLALFFALLALGACADDADEAARVEQVSHETVERFRTQVLLDLQQVDAGIAALETRVAEADSAGAALLGPEVETLREDRRALQRRIDALEAGPRAGFEENTATIERGVTILRQRVSRTTVPDTTAAPDSAAPPPSPVVPDSADG